MLCFEQSGPKSEVAKAADEFFAETFPDMYATVNVLKQNYFVRAGDEIWKLSPVTHKWEKVRM